MNKYKSWKGVRDYVRKEMNKLGHELPTYAFSYDSDKDVMTYSRLFAYTPEEAEDTLRAFRRIMPKADVNVSVTRDAYSYSYRIKIPSISKHIAESKEVRDLKNLKPGDIFLCQRPFNAKRIIYVPCKLVEISETKPHYASVLLLDMQNGEFFTVGKFYLKDIKPITNSWLEQKIKSLTYEKTRIETELSNLNKLIK